MDVVSGAGAFDPLVKAGELLRSGKDAKAAIAAIGAEDARKFLASLDVDVESRRLARACDAALECAIADDDAERAAHEAMALEALGARDRIESALVVAEEIALGSDDVRARLGSARAAIAQLDRAARSGAAVLVGINGARRAARDRLAAQFRGRAWWWSERAECDAFVAVLRGGEIDAAHVASCAACRADRERAKIADAPPPRHLTADDLWSWDVGAMSKEERRRVERHTARCVECKHAIDALADAERAIHESESPPPLEGDVVAQHEAFVVRLRRDAKRIRLVVEPRGGAVVKSASLVGAARARRTTQGLELAVAASSARGPVGLVVEVAGAADAPVGRVEMTIELTRR
jgi:hypothetical protein